MTTKGKIFTWAGIILALALAGFIYFRFYFVFGDGVKAGELNQFIYKGYVWKTYEGKLIQAGSAARTGTPAEPRSNPIYSISPSRTRKWPTSL